MPHVIQARDLRLSHGEAVVLDAVSIDVPAGELLAVIGPNGAGKTTLLRALGGLHHPQAGRVWMNGRSVESMPAAQRARNVAIIEVDAMPLTDMSVREIVTQGRLPHRPWWRWTSREEDEAIVERSLTRTGLCELEERSFETLSSGERQRVWIAMALAQEAHVLLLDEPTTHLDLRHAIEVLQLLRELARDGAAVGIVLHDLNMAAMYADRIAILGEGKLLAAGTVNEVFRDELLSRAYQTPITVRHDEGGVFAFPALVSRARAVQSL